MCLCICDLEPGAHGPPFPPPPPLLGKEWYGSHLPKPYRAHDPPLTVQEEPWGFTRKAGTVGLLPPLSHVAVALWVGVRLPVLPVMWVLAPLRRVGGRPWALGLVRLRPGEGADSEIAQNLSISQIKQTEEKREGGGGRERRKGWRGRARFPPSPGGEGPGGCEEHCAKKAISISHQGGPWALDHCFCVPALLAPHMIVSGTRDQLTRSDAHQLCGQIHATRVLNFGVFRMQTKSLESHGGGDRLTQHGTL